MTEQQPLRASDVTDAPAQVVRAPSGTPVWSEEQAAAARRLLSGGLDNPTLERLVELASRLLGAPAAQVSLLTDVQTAVAAHGVAPGTVGVGVPLSDSICLVAAQAGHRWRSLTRSPTRGCRRVRRWCPKRSGPTWAFR